MLINFAGAFPGLESFGVVCFCKMLWLQSERLQERKEEKQKEKRKIFKWGFAYQEISLGSFPPLPPQGLPQPPESILMAFLLP